VREKKERVHHGLSVACHDKPMGEVIGLYAADSPRSAHREPESRDRRPTAACGCYRRSPGAATAEGIGNAPRSDHSVDSKDHEAGGPNVDEHGSGHPEDDHADEGIAAILLDGAGA